MDQLVIRGEQGEKSAAYWRKQYQAEANENTDIREALGVEGTDPDATLSAAKVREVMALLREAKAHVIRQIDAGKHEQDRADAEGLAPRIAEALKGATR
jgi:hypothetical protein